AIRLGVELCHAGLEARLTAPKQCLPALELARSVAEVLLLGGKPCLREGQSLVALCGLEQLGIELRRSPLEVAQHVLPARELVLDADQERRLLVETRGKLSHLQLAIRQLLPPVLA